MLAGDINLIKPVFYIVSPQDWLSPFHKLSLKIIKLKQFSVSFKIAHAHNPKHNSVPSYERKPLGVCTRKCIQEYFVEALFLIAKT